MSNMNVFLLLVLVSAIESQGNPSYGLNNLKNDNDNLHLYIVSIRNDGNCHICTGSIVSENWVLSSFKCIFVTYILHGAREFGNCDKHVPDAYKNIIVEVQPGELQSHHKVFLFKVENKFGGNVQVLGLPKKPWCHFKIPKTGEVIGWSLQNGKTRCVMKEIPNVSLKQAFSKHNSSFWEVGFGSPLIAKNVVYGLLSDIQGNFTNICRELCWIKTTIKSKPNSS